MLPVQAMAAQLTISARLRELLDKYENHIYNQILQGLVDPLTVFKHLFEKYCEGCIQIRRDSSKNHSDFLKDKSINSMEDMLEHLNDYWGSHHIHPETDFYAMCFVFFLYYGAPSYQYINLLRLAIAVTDDIKNDCRNNHTPADIIQNVIDTNNLDTSKFKIDTIYSKFRLAIESNDLQRISRLYMSIFHDVSLNFSYSNLLKIKCLLPSFQEYIIKLNEYKNYRDKFIFDAITNFEHFALRHYYGHLCQFAITGRHDHELNELLIKKLIESLNCNEDDLIKHSLLVLCYCDIPRKMHCEIICHLFKLYENDEFNFKSELAWIFIWVDYEPCYKQIIIDKFVNILNCYNSYDPLVQVTLQTLADLDLSNVNCEALIPALLTLRDSTDDRLCKILIKIDIPEKYQFEVMEKLMSSVKPQFKYILQLFHRLSIAQQLYWRTMLYGLFSAHERLNLIELNPFVRAFLSSYWDAASVDDYLNDESAKGLYYLIRTENTRNFSPTIVTKLSNVKINPVNYLRHDLQKILAADSDIQTIYNKMDQYIPQEHPALNDVLFFYIVSRRNIDDIKSFLTKSPNLNFVLNSRSLLQSLADNHENGDQIAKLLISHGADINFKCPLYDAIIANNIALVRVFLKMGKNIKIYNSMIKAFEMESSDIILLFINYCLEHNDAESSINQLLWVMNNLSKKSKDADMQNIIINLMKAMPAEQKIQTLNQIVSECNSPELLFIVNQLIHAGAEIKLLNLRIACYSKYFALKIVDIIAENIRNNNPWNTSLRHAYLLNSVALGNYSNIILILKSSPYGINYRDANGKTLLHHVCEGKHLPLFQDRIDIAKILMKEGANVFIKDNSGLMPEDYIYSDTLFANNTNDIAIKIAKDNKAQWRKTFEKNYQTESLFSFLKDIAYADKTQQSTCLIALFPREILFLILQHVPIKGSQLCEQKNLVASFQGIESSIARLFNDRQTRQLTAIPQPLEQPVKELEDASEQKEDRRLASLKR